MNLLWESRFSTKDVQHNDCRSREKKGEIFEGWTFLWERRLKVLILKERIGKEPDKNRWRTEIWARTSSKFWWAGSYGKSRGLMGNTGGGYRRGAGQPHHIKDRSWQAQVWKINYKVKETGKNIFKPKVQDYCCSLHSIPAGRVNAPNLVVCSGPESGRKQFGRGCPGWVS